MKNSSNRHPLYGQQCKFGPEEARVPGFFIEKAPGNDVCFVIDMLGMALTVPWSNIRFTYPHSIKDS